MGREVGGVSGLGTRVHLWWIHVDAWQNECNIVISLQLKFKKKKKKERKLKKRKKKASVRTKLVEVMEFQLGYFKS